MKCLHNIFKGQMSGKLFQNISDDLLELMKTKPATYNSHFFAVHKEVKDLTNVLE